MITSLFSRRVLRSGLLFGFITAIVFFGGTGSIASLETFQNSVLYSLDMKSDLPSYSIYTSPLESDLTMEKIDELDSLYGKLEMTSLWSRQFIFSNSIAQISSSDNRTIDRVIMVVIPDDEWQVFLKENLIDANSNMVFIIDVNRQPFTIDNLSVQDTNQTYPIEALNNIAVVNSTSIDPRTKVLSDNSYIDRLYIPLSSYLVESIILGDMVTHFKVDYSKFNVLEKLDPERLLSRITKKVISASIENGYYARVEASVSLNAPEPGIVVLEEILVTIELLVLIPLLIIVQYAILLISRLDLAGLENQTNLLNRMNKSLYYFSLQFLFFVFMIGVASSFLAMMLSEILLTLLSVSTDYYSIRAISSVIVLTFFIEYTLIFVTRMYTQYYREPVTTPESSPVLRKEEKGRIPSKYTVVTLLSMPIIAQIAFYTFPLGWTSLLSILILLISVVLFLVLLERILGSYISGFYNKYRRSSDRKRFLLFARIRLEKKRIRSIIVMTSLIIFLVITAFQIPGIIDTHLNENVRVDSGGYAQIITPKPLNENVSVQLKEILGGKYDIVEDVTISFRYERFNVLQIIGTNSGNISLVKKNFPYLTMSQDALSALETWKKGDVLATPWIGSNVASMADNVLTLNQSTFGLNTSSAYNFRGSIEEWPGVSYNYNPDFRSNFLILERSSVLALNKSMDISHRLEFRYYIQGNSFPEDKVVQQRLEELLDENGITYLSRDFDVSFSGLLRIDIVLITTPIALLLSIGLLLGLTVYGSIAENRNRLIFYSTQGLSRRELTDIVLVSVFLLPFVVGSFVWLISSMILLSFRMLISTFFRPYLQRYSRSLPLFSTTHIISGVVILLGMIIVGFIFRAQIYRKLRIEQERDRR